LEKYCTKIGADIWVKCTKCKKMQSDLQKFHQHGTFANAARAAREVMQHGPPERKRCGLLRTCLLILYRGGDWELIPVVFKVVRICKGGVFVYVAVPVIKGVGLRGYPTRERLFIIFKDTDEFINVI